MEGENNMKQFEIYKANIPQFGSEEGTIVIILQNSINNNMDTVICAPITSREFQNDTHIKVNTQDGKIVYIMADQMINIERDKLIVRIGELSDKDYLNVKDKIMEMMK